MGYQSRKAHVRTCHAYFTFHAFLACHSEFLPHNGKYVKNSTQFSAFLNKQFAEIFYTKRLELQLGSDDDTPSKMFFQKPRLVGVAECSKS
jgi:hypothetical protein